MLEIRLLGQFDVRRDGAPVEIPSRPAQSLLAYLVLNPGTSHRREKLAGLLWPDATEANARNYLRKALWQVRKSLAADAPAGREHLLVDEIAIAFDTNAEYWLDAAALEQKVAEGAPVEVLVDALSAYRGEFLPGFYDEWVVLERERLQATFEHRMKVLLDRLVAAGRWPDVLEWGERWIALGQTPEPAYRALMAAHGGQGDMSKVASVYERCVQALRKELGVEPSQQTRALYERLSTGEEIPDISPPQPGGLHVMPPHSGSQPPGPAPHPRSTNLPVPLTSFVGREREIEDVKRMLSSARLLTLTGAGGSGKTRLAIQVASGLVDTFSDGAWWVELAALTDASLVPQAVAKALDVREAPNQPLRETLVNHLGSKRLVLVMDNCEHLIEACARLVELLLTACPGLKTLATSREGLGIPGERIFQVPTLSVPEADRLTVSRLLTYESIRLFVERAATAKSDFALTEQNAPAVAQVCRRLDGIPLALELGAARITMLKVEQIAARLDDRFRLLTGGSRTALPRHQTLQAAIDWSYDLLPEAERRMLRRLAVFAGGWTLEAAEAICSGDGVEAGDVFDLLARLGNKSLVLADRRPGEEARFRLLETIRGYAQGKLAETGEEEAARNRHLEYFVRLAEAAEPELFGPEQGTWFSRLELEHDNIRAAIDWSMESQAVTAALRLVGGLATFWYVRSHFTEGLERLARALALPGMPHRSAVRAKALNYAGFMQWARGSSTAARPLLEEALAIGRQLGSQADTAWALQFLGLVAMLDKDYEAARSFFEQGQAIGPELDPEDGYVLCWSYVFQGDVPLLQRDYAQAQILYQHGAARLRQSGNKHMLAYPLRRLGQLALRSGDLAKAWAWFQESLALNLEVVDTRAIAACFAGLAGLAVAQSQAVRGTTLFGAAEALLEASSTILLPTDQLDYERYAAAVRAQLDEATFATAWAEGRAMTFEQAVDYALAAVPDSPKVADTVPNNLPIQLSSFIGRDREIAEVTRLLSASRLVTLTGPGGCGKTRLALQVAGGLLGAYANGVWLVELASLSDSTLVPQAVASALDVREDSGRPLLTALLDYLRAKAVFLVLDNCEHLVEACAGLVETLLRACPKLRILATSREALNIAGETAWIVPSLSLPGLQDRLPAGALTPFDAIRLFVERAASARSEPAFALTDENAATVVQVCHRLDGIPLAIELAAARVKALTVEQIAARLDGRFQLLSGGRRTALPRHQTLRALMDWSYDLLSEAERALLRRLSVFAGGWTLEAAEAVCVPSSPTRPPGVPLGERGSGGGLNVLDLLSHLVDKSLVVVEERAGAARYRMLETIREYAREMLAESGETDEARDRHLAFFVRLAEEADPQLFGAAQVMWFNRLESELDNLRAALECSLESQAATAALRLAGALPRFWFTRGRVREGRERSMQILSSPMAMERTSARAKALNAFGYLQWSQGDPIEARPVLEEALGIGRELADKWNIATSLTLIGDLAVTHGEHATARSYLQESLATWRELGPAGRQGTALPLIFLGDLAVYEDDYEQAQALYEESVTLLKELENNNLLSYALRRLGQATRHQGDYDRATALCTESLTLNLEVGHKQAVVACLAGFAGIAVAQAQALRAAKLFGAVEARLEAIATPLMRPDGVDHERNLASVRAQLDEATFAAAWAEGRALTMEQAVDYALSELTGSLQGAG